MEPSPDSAEVPYTDAVIEQATRSFISDTVKSPYGLAVIAASVANIIGFFVLVQLGLRDSSAVFFVGVVAMLGPFYLALLYLYYPGKISAQLKKRLQPSARIAISATGFEVAANDRMVKLPWTDIKRILEFPEYFILIFSTTRRAFTVIPKQGLPAASQQLIRDAVPAPAR